MITFKQFFVLSKFMLSLTVSLSCLFAYVLAKNSIDFNLIYPFFAVLCLALSVSSLNQVQEYKEDALMQRTKHRPVASKQITPFQGYVISFSLMLISFILIYLSLNIKGLILFVLVIFLYNFLYTKAKKITIYAAVYGAVLGIIPPLIGWMATQKEVIEIGFLSLGLFYFIWQVPHFWLLNLKYYKDYEKADFPTITKTLGKETLERITFIWLLLTIVAGSFLSLVFIKDIYPILILIIFLNIFTLIKIFKLRSEHNYLKMFLSINQYMLVLMILLMTNSLFFL